MKAGILLYLAVNSWTDLRRREIDLRYTGVFLLFSVICQWHQGKLWDGWGILPGILLLILSKITRGQIGEGDGIVTMAVGWPIGASAAWNIMAGSFFLAAVAAIGYRVMGKREIPYLPFLTAAYLLN